MSAHTIDHKVAIIGGGNAGISLAARLRRAGMTDIGIIEPGQRPTTTNLCGRSSVEAAPRPRKVRVARRR